MDYQGLFSAVEVEMKSRLDAARFAIKHGGIKGAVVEEVVREFFSRYLPNNLAIETGILVDSTGGMSRQLDIIICDRAKTPSLFYAGGVRVIPIECAYAVIEVKTELTNKSLEQCAANMHSCKSLQRSAYYAPGAISTPVSMYGTQYDYWQLIYLIFAFESIDPIQIMAGLNRLSEGREINKIVDTIFILEHGLVTNLNGDGIDALPQPDARRTLIRHNALLLFYVLISRYFNQVVLRNFDMLPYIKNIEFGGQETSVRRWDNL